MSGFTALVPVKRFVLAKKRLSSLFSAQERAALAVAMFDDVLATLSLVEMVDNVTVVTDDGEAARIARTRGFNAVHDEAGCLNAAILAGQRALPSRGILVAPSDIPAVVPHELAATIDAARMHGVAMARATRDGGTNLLAWREGCTIRPAFGKDSLCRHMAAARAIGIQPAVLNLVNAGLDIDIPSDVAALIGRACGPRTSAFLQEVGLAARLSAGVA